MPSRLQSELEGVKDFQLKCEKGRRWMMSTRQCVVNTEDAHRVWTFANFGFVKHV